ncbi:GNAT family N-acetyltransferase [Tumebacillus lipolyticus]|uniref:Enhanced intracellular survival protein Eis n=1 Tax=Tumebacillus lipolyticus TaxID=1280370 RepID=A0ABW4ZXV1_9BACL
MTIEIRPIQDQEWERYCLIRSESYHQLSPEQALSLRSRTNLADTRCLFVDGEMQMTGRLYPFTQYLHGRALPMGGIAAIACQLEARGQGHVRALLSALLHEMREQGIPVSCLHPSTYELYRKFGYEIACEKRHFKLPFQTKLLSQAPDKADGRAVRGGEEDHSTLKKLYERHASEQNGYLKRRDEEWLKILDNPFTQTKPRIYLWLDQQEQPQGYLILQQQEEQQLEITELIALTGAALRGLLSLLERDNLLSSWEWETNLDSILPSLLHDPKQMESKSVNWFMARIVDVSRAWEITSPAAKIGKINLQVIDSFAPWNEGIWQVSVQQPGEAAVSATDSSPCASADIGTWTQIFYGYLSIDQALFLGKLSLHDPEQLPFLRSLWATAQQPMLIDYF